MPKFNSPVAKKRKAVESDDDEESEEYENEPETKSKLRVHSNLKFKKWLQIKNGVEARAEDSNKKRKIKTPSFDSDKQANKLKVYLDTPTRAKLVREVKASLTTTSFGPSTYAERYKNLNAEINIEPWWSPAQVPNVKVSKSKISLFANPPPPSAAEAKTVMPWWEQRIRLIPTTYANELTAEYHHPTIGTRKPDLILWSAGKPHNIYYISAIGEVKGRGGAKAIEEFAAEDKGQLESYLEEFLHLQPHRSAITGFLTDGYLIQFFRLRNLGVGLKFWETPVYKLEEEGGEYLIGLMNLETDMPNIKWKNKNLVIGKYLGMGSSAVVYKVHPENEETSYVLKHFKESQVQMLNVETSVLKLVAGLKSPHTTILVDALPKDFALLLLPIGQHLMETPSDYDKSSDKAVLTSLHFVQLIQFLKRVHNELGYVHRDITMNNIFLHNENVVLNDWGCAVKIKQSVSFNGALTLAPNDAVTAIIKKNDMGAMYIPKPSHDLEMVVKCVYMRLNPVFRLCNLEKTVDGVKSRVKFWKEELKGDLWQKMLSTAVKCDYQVLGELIKSILA